MQYKAVVFDYGGVLVQNPSLGQATLFEEIAKVLDVSVADLRSEYFKHNHLANVENKPWTEVFATVAFAFTNDSEKVKEVVALIHAFHGGSIENRELLDVIEKLNAAGYMVAILSNYTSELREVIAKNGIEKYFAPEHVFVSSEIGYQKPNPEAFLHVCRALEISPEEMVFIDDSEKSLSTAEEVGYAPIQFTENESLFARLAELEILPKT